MQQRLSTLLALVLLAQGLAPLTEQLAKWPALVTHFYAHHDHNHLDHGDELSMLDFLAQHYSGQAHHDDASQDHSNLPFRGADVSCAMLLLSLPADVSLPDVIVLAPVFSAQTAFGSTPFHSRLFGQGIFRPPLG